MSSNSNKRYTGRVQVNFFDPEPGYFNLSTYVGKKKTIGLGLSLDGQNEIATDTIKGSIDYQWVSFDAFADWPLGPGTLTAEGAFSSLDLDDATSLNDGSASQPVDARQTQGNGWFAQLGYLITDYNTQPWIGFESWESDAPNGLGGWDAWRIGLTYFIKGHNANIKAGYEQFKSDQNFTGSTPPEDSVDTFLVGFYITY